MVEAVITVGCNITSTSLALANHLRRNSFQVIGLSNGSHRVYEDGGQIEAPAQLRSGVIPGKNVVVVVEPVAADDDG